MSDTDSVDIQKKRLVSSFLNTKMPRESSGNTRESVRCWCGERAKKMGNLLKALQLSKFSFKFQLRQTSEDFWVPTYSEELITSDNELITNDWDRMGSAPLSDACDSCPSQPQLQPRGIPHQCTQSCSVPLLDIPRQAGRCPGRAWGARAFQYLWFYQGRLHG